MSDSFGLISSRRVVGCSEEVSVRVPEDIFETLLVVAIVDIPGARNFAIWLKETVPRQYW